ncbi:MAG: hypothetical protein ACI9QD_000562 [Thermoproteota archaeon]|jgi:hypothetical protein
MEIDWFIIRAQEHVGPYTIEELEDFYQNDKITLDTALWKTGLDKPIAFRDVANLISGSPKNVNEYSFQEEAEESVDDFFNKQEEQHEHKVIEEEQVDNIIVIDSEFDDEFDYSSDADDKDIFSVLESEKSEEPPPLPLLPIVTEVEPQASFTEMKVVKEDRPNLLKDLAGKVEFAPVIEFESEGLAPLEIADEISFEDKYQDDFRDDDIKKNKKIMLLNNLIWVPIILISLILFKLGYEVYVIKYSTFYRPKGMSQRDYKRLKTFLKSSPGNKKTAVSFAKDYSRLWVALDFPYSGNGYIKLRSLKDQTLSDTPVDVIASGKIKSKLMELSEFRFEKGVKLYAGYYELKVNLIQKRKRSLWLKSLFSVPQSFEIKSTVYIGKNRKSFADRLSKYLEKRDSADRHFWQGLIQRFETLNMIVGQIYDDFGFVLKDLDTSEFTSKIKVFENNYKSKYGQFLTSFVLENQKSFEQVQRSDADKKGALIANHNRISSLSVEVGEVSMDILALLEELSVNKDKKKILEIKNQLLPKLQSIIIQCSNHVGIIRNEL